MNNSDSSTTGISGWIEEVMEATGGDLNEVPLSVDSEELERIRERSMDIINQVAIRYRGGLVLTSQDRRSLLQAVARVVHVSEPREMILSLLDALSMLKFADQEPETCLSGFDFFVFLLRLIFDCFARDIPNERMWLADVLVCHLSGLRGFMNWAIEAYGLQELIYREDLVDMLTEMIVIFRSRNELFLAIDSEQWLTWMMKIFEILFPLFLRTSTSQLPTLYASHSFEEEFRGLMREIMGNIDSDLLALARWHRSCLAKSSETGDVDSTAGEKVTTPEVCSLGFFLAACASTYGLPLRVYKAEYVFCELLPSLVVLFGYTFGAVRHSMIRNLFIWFLDRIPEATFSRGHLEQVTFQDFVYQWMTHEIADAKDKNEACALATAFLNLFSPDGRLLLYRFIFSTRVQEVVKYWGVQELSLLRSVLVAIAQQGLQKNGDIVPKCGSGPAARELLWLFTALPERLLESVKTGSHFAQLSQTFLFMQKLLLLVVKAGPPYPEVLSDFRAIEKSFLEPLEEALSKCIEGRLEESHLSGNCLADQASDEPNYASLLNIVFVTLMDLWHEVRDR